MATVLDIGLLNYFYIIFPFLLIYAGTFGVLSWLKIFGDNKLLHTIIAIVIAFMFVLSTNLVKVVNMMVPWMVMMFILIIFLIVAYKFLGAKDADISNALLKDKTIIVWILIIFLIIMLGSISKIYFAESAPIPINGQGTITAGQGEVGQVGAGAFWSTLFNQKVLAVIVILLIATFAILLLSGSSVK